jgi:TonB family protein
MMPAINGVMLAVSSSLAASIVAKATVTTALSLAGVRLARRSRAAVRHALLAAAFGVLVALPVASIVTRPFLIPVPVSAQERNPANFARGTTVVSAPPLRPSVGAPSAIPQPKGFSPSALLLTVWIAGTTLFLLPVPIGLWQVRRLRRSALPWAHGQLAVERLALEAGIHRRVTVLLHDALCGPMTCGALHPTIVLPQDAETWPSEDLNRALVHELEHVLRADWVSLCLSRAACAMYWFHPLVWIAWRQLALDAERSCDDAVLVRSESTAYADQLVQLARRLSASATTPLLAMANRADLATRVGAVLDGRQRRGRAGRLPVALACAAAAVLVIILSPLRVVAAQQSASTDVTPASMPRYSANTMLAIETVTVSDKNGKNIEGLTSDDFVLTEDGVSQTIGVLEFQKPAAPLQGPPDSILSYYILGYYPTNPTMDRNFRKIAITRKNDPSAKLDYRAGYYPIRPNGPAFFPLANGGVDRNLGPDSPVVLYRQLPGYSDEARKAKHQGTVVLQVEIDASGQVTNPKVVRSVGLGLDQKATEAVMQWKFKPAMKDGKPVTVEAAVEVNFRLL